MKKVSFLMFIGVAFMVISGLYTGYVVWGKTSAESEVKTLDNSIADYQVKVLEKEKAKITQAISAKQTVNDLKKNLIEWSKVINLIRVTLPKEKLEPIVKILSYSGSGGNDISLNMKTLVGRQNSYFDVADVIKSFNDSTFFADAFVPSISSGTDDKGNDVLSFVVSAKYVPATDEQINAALSDILQNSLDTKAPVAGTSMTVAPLAPNPISR